MSKHEVTDYREFVFVPQPDNWEAERDKALKSYFRTFNPPSGEAFYLGSHWPDEATQRRLFETLRALPPLSPAIPIESVWKEFLRLTNEYESEKRPTQRFAAFCDRLTIGDIRYARQTYARSCRFFPYSSPEPIERKWANNFEDDEWYRGFRHWITPLLTDPQDIAILDAYQEQWAAECKNCSEHNIKSRRIWGFTHQPNSAEIRDRNFVGHTLRRILWFEFDVPRWYPGGWKGDLVVGPRRLSRDIGINIIRKGAKWLIGGALGDDPSRAQELEQLRERLEWERLDWEPKPKPKTDPEPG